MSKILIFAGTTEGRKLSEHLCERGIEREAEAKKARDAEVERLKAEDAAYKAQKKAEKLAKKGKK